MTTRRAREKKQQQIGTHDHMVRWSEYAEMLFRKWHRRFKMKQNHFVSISKSFEDTNHSQFYLRKTWKSNQQKSRPILSKCSTFPHFHCEIKSKYANIQRIERITNKICHNKVSTEHLYFFSVRKCERIRESLPSFPSPCAQYAGKKMWPSFIFIGNASEQKSL